MKAALRWACVLAGSTALHVAALTAAQVFGDAPGRPRTVPGAVRPDVRITLSPTRAVPPATASPQAPAESPPAPAIAAFDLGGLGGPLAPTATAPLPEIAPLEEVVQALTIDPSYAYRRPIELTARPALLTMLELEMPRSLGSAAAPGRLRMRLLISEFGRIDRVIVDESTLPEEAQQFAIERFAAARFKPGELDGRPVPSQVTIEVSSAGG